MSKFVAGVMGAAAFSMAFLVACSGESDGGTSTTPIVVENVTDAELAPLLAAANAGTPSLPLTEDADLVELGRALFYDKILSGNRDISCATCHHTTAFGGDDLPVSLGTGASGTTSLRTPSDPHDPEEEMIPRNAPTLFNLGADGADMMFHDGRVTMNADGTFNTPQPEINGAFAPNPEYVAVLDSALAAQAMFPVTSREEMRGLINENEIADAVGNVAVWEALMARLVGTNNGTVGGIQEYRDMFQAAYPGVTNFDDFNFAHAARAMAAFERVEYESVNSPFDQYLAGDMNALSDQEKRGAYLFFGEAKCSTCHSGPHMMDFEMHNIALPQVGPGKENLGGRDDLGLYLRTNNAFDRYKFRTPPLRNIALSGPWGHSGSYTTLRGIVEHHLDPATANANYDVNQLPLLFRPTYNDDPVLIEARVNRVDPELATPIDLNEQQIQDLVAFLHALTDQDVVNNLHEIAPETVPSGLPVED